MICLRFLSAVILCVLQGIWSDLCAQDPTDLYAFHLTVGTEGNYTITSPKYLSGFNTGGYTNQPWFTSDGKLLVSVRKKGGDQTDIYQLDLARHSVKRMSATKANEYSPRLSPDGQSLTVLRQVEGDSMDQQVWKVPVSGGAGESVAPHIRNAGYYAWLDPRQMAIYRLEGESNSLELYNLQDGRSRRIATAVGRTLLADPGGNVVYVHKFDSTYWYLKRYNPLRMTIDIIAQTPVLSEDFALSPDGTFFMGGGSILYAFHPGVDTAWKKVADLSQYDIHGITRLAISPDGRTLVLANVKKKV